MKTNKNNNNQILDEDDEPTMELEPLSKEACARFELADDSPARSDSASENGATEQDSVEAEAQISGTNASAIRELQDELKFREEMNSILQFGIDQERGKRRALEEQVSSLQKTSNNLRDQLGQSRQQVTHTKKKLREARDSEKALLSNLKKLGEADSANAAGADQDTIDQLRKDKLKLTDAVSDLEAKLESLTQDANGFETRIVEARKENATRISDRQTEGGWALVGLDDAVSGTYHLDDGMVTIGSAPDSDVRIQSNFVSRHHAQLVQTHQGSVLGDLNSTNGTFINCRRIRKRVLRTGDIVTIGKHQFRYEKQSGKSIMNDMTEYPRSVNSMGTQY
jgi:predicted  nucleic acid-binding Zn-ribbon protein